MFARPSDPGWRVDETCVRVDGRWTYPLSPLIRLGAPNNPAKRNIATANQENTCIPFVCPSPSHSPFPKFVILFSITSSQ